MDVWCSGFYTLAMGRYLLIAEGRFQSIFCDYHLITCQRWSQEEESGGEGRMQLDSTLLLIFPTFSV